MIAMVTRKVFLRPTRSPTRPKTSAPKGRIAKPAAKAISARMKPVVSLNPAKKWTEIALASRPQREKTYHSNTVPSDDAAHTSVSQRALGAREGGGWLSVALRITHVRAGGGRLVWRPAPPRKNRQRATPRASEEGRW